MIMNVDTLFPLARVAIKSGHHFKIWAVEPRWDEKYLYFFGHYPQCTF